MSAVTPPQMHRNLDAPPRGAAQGMRLWRLATVWDCEAPWVEDGANGAIVWEPLKVEAPSDAKPYCCYINTVIFYAPGTIREIARCEHYGLLHPEGHCLRLGNRVFEPRTGSIVYAQGRWWMRWELRRPAWKTLAALADGRAGEQGG